jgi:hypothetical protein
MCVKFIQLTMNKILLVFILSLSNDYLLRAIYTDWDTKESNTETNVSDLEISNDSEAEHYSWQLGTPDNEKEIIIIYENSNPCESTYRY